MRKYVVLMLLVCFVVAQPLMAGAKFDLGNDAKLSLGGLVQVQNGWNKSYNTKSSSVRRARVKMVYDYKDLLSVVTQTEVGASSGGRSLKLIDAYAVLKLNKNIHIYNGMHLAPANRQNITSSAVLMGIDRPGVVYKSQSWGGTGKGVFNSVSIGSGGLINEVGVRDNGVTLFGQDSFNAETHIKYYLGVYNGNKGYSDSGERITGRVQVNLKDAEAGYYCKSTYLGEKDTVAFGLSYDLQPNAKGVVNSTTYIADYKYVSLDVFAEKPLANGTISIEGAYSTLDLGDTYKVAEGKGYYLQVGYYMPEFNAQPWLVYENWQADAEAGDYSAVKLGGTYFLNGNSLNIKAGIEKFMPSASSGLADTYSGMCGIYAAF
jgi:hypothetical protein